MKQKGGYMAEKTKQTYTRTGNYENSYVTTTFSRKGKVRRVEAGTTLQGLPAENPLAGMIDHTLLKPDATQEQIAKLCQEALDNGFGAVCVNSYWVPFCANYLRGSSVKVGSTVGFALGANSTKAKTSEAKKAIKQGAREIDMVMNVGALKSGDLAAFAEDIRKVVRVCHRRNALLKVILETCLLTEDEKVTACLIAKEVGADFVKTSTGFNGPGATVEDVRLMRSVVGPNMGVKAAGGVRTYEDAMRMIEAGATRIGTSSGIKIIGEAAQQS